MSKNEPQFCAICAWRENCAKKFCVPDGGAKCPDYTRDISIRNPDSNTSSTDSGNNEQQDRGDR